MMEHNSISDAEGLLEKIFYYMNRLFEEKEFSSTIVLLTDLGRTLVSSDRASIWFWDKRNHEYWTLAAIGYEKITVEENTGIVGASISTNEIIVINNPYEDMRFNTAVDKSTGYVTKSIICMPVTNSEGEVIGAYQAINKIDGDGEDSSFNDTDVNRLSMAAAFCGRAIESYILHNETLIDQLSGLKNRRGFFDYYTKRLMPVLEKDKAAIIMCDIDHFKKVNDTYGHNTGDEILKLISDTLVHSVGIDDEVVRWGGEEFIILLPKKDIEYAAKLAEIIRKRVEAAECIFEDMRIKVTMSFGVNSISYETSPEENVKLADNKLYIAKESGRNRVIK